MPGGKDRYHLCTSIPLVQEIARLSNNQEFINEFDEYLKLIEYDYAEVFDELNSSVNELIRKRT